ncbi:MAG: 3-deoxy-8-phosphooctulonate synthase [Desulfovibrionaceae bacterium]|nr:3-deoxy-8-phosphooctulonate synthase [Desulfovibrionaceae bacterium]
MDLYAGLRAEPFVIAGPCVLENYELARDTALAVREAAEAAGITAVFKSSYDKANRSALQGFRGPGMSRGLEWLARIREESGLPVLTDVHEAQEVEEVAEVADILQIPAFLSRQTSLLLAAGWSGRIVNVKKGQFLAPWEMGGVLDKVRSTGNTLLLATERGFSFGYNNLVVDMRSFAVMREFGVPVIMDATHAAQLPGAQGNSSGGDRRHVPALARAAVAAGADGVFLECHPDPDQAKCDGPNSLYLRDLPGLLKTLAKLWEICRA